MSDSLKKELIRVGIAGGAGALLFGLYYGISFSKAQIAPEQVGTAVLYVIVAVLIGILYGIGLAYIFPKFAGWIGKTLKFSISGLGEIVRSIFSKNDGFPLVGIFKLLFGLLAFSAVAALGWLPGLVLAALAIKDAWGGTTRAPKAPPGDSGGGWGDSGGGGWEDEGRKRKPRAKELPPPNNDGWSEW